MKGVLALVSHLSAGENILLTVTPITVEMIKVSCFLFLSYSYSLETLRPFFELVGNDKLSFFSYAASLDE